MKQVLYFQELLIFFQNHLQINNLWRWFPIELNSAPIVVLSYYTLILICIAGTRKLYILLNEHNYESTIKSIMIRKK